MGHSHYVNEVEELLEEIRVRNTEGHGYLLKIPREKWLRSFDGGHRYGHMTTNLAEAINSSLNGDTTQCLCGRSKTENLLVWSLPNFQVSLITCHCCCRFSPDSLHAIRPVYLLETVFKVYEHEFSLIRNECDPDVVDDEPTIQPNPAIRRDLVGRPTSSRIYCAEDMVQHQEKTRQKNLCTVCRNPGHNRSNCPNKSHPQL
ncbi:hypothetical protein GQ457_01G022010 [Hibiscus cannabinus]